MIRLWSKYKIIYLPILLIIVILIGFLAKDHTPIEVEKNNEWQGYVETALPVSAETTQIQEEKDKEVPVYVCGAVRKSGVYYVREDVIIDDLISLAGGLMEEADLTSINLARAIKAHEKIYVPKQGEKIDKSINSYENVEYEDKLININEATLSQLDTLPGIGETRAKQIIEYRETNGPFSKKEDIKKVSGIGTKIYESLQDLISIE